MKYLKLTLLALILFFIPLVLIAKEDVKIYLFYLSTCPHCANEKVFLQELEQEYNNLEIKMYEVSGEYNSSLLEKVKTKFGSETVYVPFTAIGEKYFIGFNENTKAEIIKLVQTYSDKVHRDLAGEALGLSHYEEPDLEETDPTPEESETEEQEEDKTIIIPILGKINPKNISLPIVAIVIGIIDGFNPCAMWVLLFLISMLLGMKDKKRMWALGLTFLSVSALIYLLFMMAWLQVAITLNQIVWIRILIALIACIGGIINLRNYLSSLKKDNGCEIVDDKKRKKMINQIKKFTTEQSFILALLGVSALALSVNLVELACSTGLPLLFTQILSLNDLPFIQYFTYMIIYILFFLIDDIIVFVIAMKTLQVTGITTKYSKYSHLIGGILMFIIGLLLIFKPEWIMFNF